MIYIQKQRTPEISKRKAIELMRAPENGYAAITLPRDTKKLRDLFEQMPKPEIKDALYKEQHGLCAYCMKRIESRSYGSMRIEHYEALSKSKERALDYKNYLGVCNGGEKEETDKTHILCCDAARKEKNLTIDPWNKRQMEAIGYKRNGEIFVLDDVGLDPKLVEDMQNDIDKVICINGQRDKAGNMCDTATKLVATRKNIYESVSLEFKRWDDKKCLTAGYLKEKIDALEKQLTGEAIAQEFIGVRLYFYKRKYKKLNR